VAALELTNRVPALIFALAQIAWQEGRGREAVELVDRGLALSPENAAARRYRTHLTDNPAAN
jgi:hypothetical protein